MGNEDNYGNYEDDMQDNDEEQDSGSKLMEIYYNNKKLIWVLIIIIVLVIVASLLNGKGGSGGVSDSIVASVNDPEQVQVSRTKQIRVKVRNQEYEGSYDSSYWNWTSQNPEIVEVDSSGRITGVSIGKGVIKGVYNENGSAHVFDVNVVVVNGNENIALQSVDFGGESLIINNRIHEFSLGSRLNVTPDDGYIYDLSYKSSNSNVATVDESGIVRGVGNGSATITVNINEGAFSTSIDVYVRDGIVNPEMIKIPQKIEFEDGQSMKLPIDSNGSLKELALSLSPSDASKKYINWKSSDDNIVIVTDEGMVSGVKEGNATITATALNGKQGKILIEVTGDLYPVTGISVPSTSIRMKINSSQSLNPTVSPSNASNKALTFQSSNTSVVSVIPSSAKTSATLQAGSTTGSAVITITSNNGKSATINVEVYKDGGGGGGTGGDDSDVGLYKVRINGIDGDKPQKECDGSEVKYYKPPVTLNVSYVSGPEVQVAYCITKDCTPSASSRQKLPIEINVTEAKTFILRIKKFDKNGKEITASSSGNYVNGAFEYYINTKSDGLACKDRNSWYSGGSTTPGTTSSDGACYVNSSSQGIGTNFIWKNKGDAVPSGLVTTTISNETDCNKAHKGYLCFKKGNNYEWGSEYSVKSDYTYVPGKTTVTLCKGSTSPTSTPSITKSYTVQGLDSDGSLKLKVNDEKKITISLTPSPYGSDVTIESSSSNRFTVDGNAKIKTNVTKTITIKAKDIGYEKLTIDDGHRRQTIPVTIVE